MSGQAKLMTAGGGGVILNPASSIASDVIVNIPSANCTVLTTASAGTVLQVVSVPWNTPGATTSTSYVASGLAASITPTSTTSKILIFVSHGDCASQASANGMKLILRRNSTTLCQFSNNQLYAAAGGVGYVIGSAGNLNYMDSPATTSSVSYNTQWASQNGSSVEIFRDSTFGGITLMEIAA